MKLFSFLCLFVIPASALFCQTNHQDSLAVRSVIQQYETAWNKNDMDGISNLFTEDASWINIGGLYWKNRNEISRAHHAFAPVLKYMIPVDMPVQNIQFIASGVAIVITRFVIHMNHELVFPDGRKVVPGDIIYDQMSLVLVRNAGTWQIKMGHNSYVDPASEAIDPVKHK